MYTNQGSVNNLGKAQPSSIMGAAGATMMQSSHSIVSKLPCSFKSTLDQIEEDILQLAQEVAFCKKEVNVLHSE
jgi:hypothetical protein